MKNLKLFGFVGVNGFGGRDSDAGTMFGWDVSIERETEKAYLLRDSETKRTTWIPKSTLRQPSKNGEIELTKFGVDCIRKAYFRASHVYGDVL